MRTYTPKCLSLFGALAMLSACSTPIAVSPSKIPANDHQRYLAQCEQLKHRLAHNRKQQWIAYSRPAGTILGVSGQALKQTTRESHLSRERQELLFVYRKNCQPSSLGEYFSS